MQNNLVAKKSSVIIIRKNPPQTIAEDYLIKNYTLLLKNYL